MNTQELVYNNSVAEWVASALIRSNSYKLSNTPYKEEWYTWKSGIVAPVYCNTRTLYGSNFGRRVAIAGLSSCLKDCFSDANGVVGLATAGIGWASIVAYLSDLPCGYVRSIPKSHGVSGMVDYSSCNAKIVLIDDLIASGESLAVAAQHLEKMGLEVIGIISIVNWGFNHMHEILTQYNVKALCSYDAIVQHLFDLKLISSTQATDLRSFYKNPKEHVWSCPEFSCLQEMAA